jgi:large subunit ribosomal protein L24
MKQDWSKSWVKSKKPRKQRKYVYNAPLHISQKFLGAHLATELKKKYSKRAMPVRKGDKVKIVRGQFKGKSGKIVEVDLKKTKVFVEGIEISKKEGSKVRVSVNPSNLVITELNLDDKKREAKIKEKISG